MRALIGTCLVAALFVAGCASKSTDGNSTSGTGTEGQASNHQTNPGTTTHATTTQGATTAGTTTTANGGGSNHSPTGTITTDVPGGAVPLNVTFTLTGADADKDPLSWTLDPNGDGKVDSKQDAPAQLPATVHYTYSAAGLFHVTYALSDGKSTTTYHADVNVSASGTQATKSFSGHVVGPDANENSEGECLFALVSGTTGEGSGIAGDEFTLGKNYSGWSFAFDVDGMVAQFENSAGYVGDKAASGTVPAGATGVLTCSHSAVNTDYTLTLTAP